MSDATAAWEEEQMRLSAMMNAMYSPSNVKESEVERPVAEAEPLDRFVTARYAAATAASIDGWLEDRASERAARVERDFERVGMQSTGTYSSMLQSPEELASYSGEPDALSPSTGEPKSPQSWMERRQQEKVDRLEAALRTARVLVDKRDAALMAARLAIRAATTRARVAERVAKAAKTFIADQGFGGSFRRFIAGQSLTAEGELLSSSDDDEAGDGGEEDEKLGDVEFRKDYEDDGDFRLRNDDWGSALPKSVGQREERDEDDEEDAKDEDDEDDDWGFPKVSRQRWESADDDEDGEAQGGEPNWAAVDADPVNTAGTFAVEGLVGLRQVLCASQVQRLRTFVDEHLVRRQEQANAPNGSKEEPAALAAFARWFGAVRERHRRYDLKLDSAVPVVHEALRTICAALSPILEQTLTSDAIIVELSTLISDPGTNEQQWHSDSVLPSKCGASLITCFVALQDIDANMGPTRLLPRTHNEKSHVRLRDPTPSAGTRRYRDAAAKLAVDMSCGAGDVYMMDSRLWHRGGGNASQRRRRLLYVTFGVPYCRPEGSTYSMLEELKGRLKLRDFV